MMHLVAPGRGEEAAASLRVLKMRQEARAFDSQLSSFQDSTVRFAHATSAFLATLDPILRAPLPRVWSSVEGGLAEPIRAPVSHEHGHTVGGDALFGGLEEARHDQHERLLREVVQPADAWRESLRDAEARIPELLKLQSSVDKRRARVEKTRVRFERRLDREREQEEREATTVAGEETGGRSSSAAAARRGHRNPLARCFLGYPGAYDDEEEGGRPGYDTAALEPAVRREIAEQDAGVQVSQKQRKLDAAAADFRALEDLLGGHLAGLNADASWVKSYAVSALLVAKEAMQVGVVSLGKTKQPLPSFSTRHPAEMEGALEDNIELAAGLPPMPPRRAVAPEPYGPAAPSTAAPGARPPSPPLVERVYARRVTAQPLETHARPDLTGLERVATPPAGASDIALPTAGTIAAQQRMITSEAALPRAAAQPPVAVRAAAAPPMGMGVSPGAATEAMPTAQTPEMMGAVGVGGIGGGMATRRREREEMEEERQEGPAAVQSAAAAAARLAAAPPPGEESRPAGAVPVTTGVGGVTTAPAMGGGAVETELGTGIGMGTGMGMEGRPRRASEEGEEEVCERRPFMTVEDRPVVVERVERFVEHRPVEKAYVTETRFVGERAAAGVVRAERIGPAEERIVAETPPGPACPVTPAAAGSDVGVGVVEGEMPGEARAV